MQSYNLPYLSVLRPVHVVQAPLVVQADDIAGVLQVSQLVDLDGVVPAAGRLPDGGADTDPSQALPVVLRLQQSYISEDRSNTGGNIAA